MKELWEVKPENHKQGQVTHTMGWPLGIKTGGGSFMYHLEDNLVSIGFVVHLNYQNPHLFPYMEFQRFKHHPLIAQVLEGGRRVAYGARAITEGGFQSVPKLYFPGGVLIGCSAGFVNVPRIKGIAQRHEDRHDGGRSRRSQPWLKAAPAMSCADYEAAYEKSWVYQDLKRVKNVKPMWSKLGLIGGLALGGLDMWLQPAVRFWLRHLEAWQDRLRHAEAGMPKFKTINYPEARWRVVLRPPDQRGLLGHQP